LPVIVISSLGQSSCRVAIEALELGAVEVLAKPGGPYSVGDLRTGLGQKIRAAARAKLRRSISSTPPPPLVAKPAAPAVQSSSWPSRSLIAIGASTGGTEATLEILKRMPEDSPGILVVQHMPAGFTRAFANRLNQRVPVCVREAEDGEVPGVGEALIARGDTHLVVRSAAVGWRVQYTHQEPVNRHCPSVDVLFESVAQVARARAVGVLLTGMGADGARGLLAMRAAGAATIAQSAETCVVYGMPKVAVDLGAALHSAAPPAVPARVRRILQERGHAPRAAGAVRAR
jgi:two-component system chemotaxis response regulator CheB